MMQADPEWRFKHTLALARGMTLDEIEEMPLNEYHGWIEYDAHRPLDPWFRQAALCTVVVKTFTNRDIPVHKLLPNLPDDVMNPPKTEEEMAEWQKVHYERMMAGFGAAAKLMNKV